MDLQIKVTDGSWMENRNGMPEIREAVIFIRGGMAGISGIGKSGKELRGGIRVTPEDMDRIAAEWLKCRKIATKDTVMLIVPNEVWDLLHQTLVMDSNSGAFDQKLREQISKALHQVERVSP
jgi:hypothetical protein